MPSKMQQRDHSHHNHNEENTFLTSSDVEDPGVRITKIGLYVNIGILILKAIGGYAFHSEALKADAAHAFTDLGSDAMTLATVNSARKPPTARFPYGYGKIESLGSIGVSGLLLATGLGIGFTSATSLLKIYLPEVAEMLESLPFFGHAHHHHVVPDLMAIPLVLLTIGAKEWLYHATLRVARERKSSVLASNAVHHRADALTGVVTIIAIALSNWKPEFAGMDALGGLLISGLVVKAGWGNTWQSILELADASVDDEVKNKVRRATNTALDLDEVRSLTKSEIEVANVTGMKAGQNLLMDLELAVPQDMTVAQTKQIEGTVRETIRNKVRGVRRVKIRFVPSNEERTVSYLDEFLPTPEQSPRSSPEPEENGHKHIQSNSSPNHARREGLRDRRR